MDKTNLGSLAAFMEKNLGLYLYIVLVWTSLERLLTKTAAKRL
jgi:hypothetical protein